ncbi:MAG: hypothetical protein KDD10_14760 [Phaeodactylibacter sp.]|nr:hypothetical protein [Phaeodactylibacter sp.]MCB9298021.1 hypothetical protein [Lewinellaceae bacterium]
MQLPPSGPFQKLPHCFEGFVAISKLDISFGKPVDQLQPEIPVHILIINENRPAPDISHPPQLTKIIPANNKMAEI